MQNNTENQEKAKRKVGRTILINSDYKDEVNYEGLNDVHTTQSGSRFLVFDSKENSSKAFDDLQEKNVKAKYPYYKVFFRLKDVELQNVQYDELKDEVQKVVNSLNDVEVLYFKFYTKNKELMGSGDLTVDTKDGLDQLVNTTDLEFSKGKINFYRFRLKKNSNRPPGPPHQQQDL